MKCSECFCYVKRPTTDDEESGWCYLNPQTILVAHDHWCSHHNLKRPICDIMPTCKADLDMWGEMYAKET